VHLGSMSALITLPSAVSDRLMLLASFRRSPVAPVYENVNEDNVLNKTTQPGRTNPR
jgi:hypothetical protein